MFDELPNYRPVSRLAVASLAVGVSSVLVLLSPLAAMLPLVAIVLAATALAGIRASEGRLAGRWPALGGLALAIGFSSQALSTAFVEGLIADRRAAATATAWLDAIRDGRSDDAFAMTSPGSLPLPAHESHGAIVDTESRRQKFASMPEVQAVAGCGSSKPHQTVIERTKEGWTVRFSLEPCGSRSHLDLAVLRRTVTARGHLVEEWRVNAFALNSD